MANLLVLLLALCVNQALADESTIDTQQRQLTKTKGKIVFSASLGCAGNFGPFNTPFTLAYKALFVNIGNAYNPGTGIFTAPLKGVYFFNFAGHNQSTRAMGLSLMKNGVRVAVAFNHPNSAKPYDTATNGVAIALERGDYVYMQLFANTWVFDNSDYLTTFTGFLVSEL